MEKQPVTTDDLALDEAIRRSALREGPVWLDTADPLRRPRIIGAGMLEEMMQTLPTNTTE